MHLDSVIIRPPQTELARPTPLTPKKGVTIRFFVDFGRLNVSTIPDMYPLPRMEEFSNSLQDPKVMAILHALW